MRLGIFSAAIVLGCVTAAQSADLLASGPLFGSADQTTAVCYFYNTGDTTLQFTNKRILEPNSFVVPLTGNTCPSTGLIGRHVCSITATNHGLPISCKATVSPSKADARGILEVLDGMGTVLQTTGLR